MSYSAPDRTLRARIDSLRLLLDKRFPGDLAGRGTWSNGRKVQQHSADGARGAVLLPLTLENAFSLAASDEEGGCRADPLIGRLVAAWGLPETFAAECGARIS